MAALSASQCGRDSSRGATQDARHEDGSLPDPERDHACQWSFNRMLPSFSSAVSGLACSPNGQWLASSVGSGDIRVWNTGCWAEAAKIRSGREEQHRGLAMSPVLDWMVSVQPSALSVFQCGAPWPLEQVIPAMVNPGTGETSEWQCVAFSPTASEIEHWSGTLSQNCLLVATSTTHLCTMDYSGGWGPDMKRCSQTLLRFTRPMSVTFTPCGQLIIVGFESGQVHIWDALSLSIVKKLSAHVGEVNCVVASPRSALYDTRAVSCGMDWTLCVWHSSGWDLEQTLSLFDDGSASQTPSHAKSATGGRGVSSCAFAPSGDWFMSAARDVWIWRVSCESGSQFALQIHQRLVAVGSNEAPGMAVFCAKGNAIVVGSCDGVLNLWRKQAGAPRRSSVPAVPPRPTSQGEVFLMSSSGRRARSAATVELNRPPRPMRRLSPSPTLSEGVPSPPRQETLTRSMRRLSPSPEPLLESTQPKPCEWSHSANVRQMVADRPATTQRSLYSRKDSKLPLHQSGFVGLPSLSQTAHRSAAFNAERSGDRRDRPQPTEHTGSMPEIARWTARRYEVDSVLRSTRSVSPGISRDLGKKHLPVRRNTTSGH